MARFSRAITAIALAGVASLAHAAPWFGDSRGAHRLDPVTNQSTLDVASPPPVALALGADGSVWSLTTGRLTHYAQDGSALWSGPVSLPSSRGGGGRWLALDRSDGSAWIAAQGRLLHVAEGGAALGSIDLAADDLAVSRDGTVWALARRELRRYSAQGALLGTTLLPGAENDPRLFALDEAGGKVWVSGSRQLSQRDLSDPSAVSLTLALGDDVAGLSVDGQTGTLWVLGKTTLVAYARSGALTASVRLRDRSIVNPQAISADGSQQALWIGHPGGLTRLDTSGALVAQVPGATSVRSVAAGDSAPLDVQPTLAVVRPQPGSLTTGRPALVFQYGATCNGGPCGFPGSAYASYRLAATLDGAPVGGLFAFNAATGQASYTPASPLSDGPHTLTGQVTNAAGATSAEASTTFTSDGTAPEFLSIDPPSGSVFTAAQLLITGSVDDPLATVRLSNGQVSSGGTFFNFAVTLSPGTNAFTLTATDGAGNATSAALSYTYDPPNSPPVAAITSPAGGTTFTAPANIAIAASASDPDGSVVRVDFLANGALIGSDTTAPYAFTWSNVGLGTYSLAAQAIDNRGAVTLSSPVVVSVGPPNALPTVALKSPTSGTSFSAPASVRAVATASDSDGTIARVEFLRDGVVAATVTAPPYEATISGISAGTHTIAARATDDRGGSTTSAAATVSVVATSLAITSPQANASITGDSVLVTGATAGLSNRGVTVNDVVAAVDAAGNFAALVPVTPGGNTLTATLTAPDGAALTQSVTIFATGVASPFSVTATPTVGMAPLAVTFTVQNPTSNDASYMFDTSGPFSLPAGASSTLSLTYPAGVFSPNVVITDAAGQMWSHRVVVDARDPVKMDQLFRAMWSNMNAALVAGDKQGALRYLSDHGQQKFGPAWDVLMPYMAQIVASYSPLAQGSIGTGITEYAVARMDHGVKRLYLITYLSGTDGVWRIDEM